MQLKCTDWFTSCGEELSLHCDTLVHCQTKLYMDSPSFIPEEMWCIKLYGDFPDAGYVETYITGQSGAKVYELKYWMRSDSAWGGLASLGYASIGSGAQSHFSATKTLETSNFEWTQYSFKDTLSLDASDTLTVRLSSEICDLCFSQVKFDFIELTVVDTITSVENMQLEEVKVYPNPASENFSVDLSGQYAGECLLSVYDITGKSILRSVRFREKMTMNTEDLASGLYIYSIERAVGNEQIGRGKILIR